MGDEALAATSLPYSSAHSFFDETEASFLSFLHEQGHAGELVWVFREDVSVGRGGELMLLPSDREDNRRRIQELLERDHPLGIAIEALAGAEDSLILAYVFVPEDLDEAERMNVRGVTFRVHAHRAGIRASHRPRWLAWLSRRFGRERHFWLSSLIPSRHSRT